MNNEPFDPVKRCIYCDAARYSNARKHFGKEHIIPEGLGGKVVLPEASCLIHERMTNESENFCQNDMMVAFRYRLGIKGKRRKKQRPKILPADFLIGNEWKQCGVLLTEYPVTMLIPTLPIPDLIRPAPIEKSTLLQYSMVELWDMRHAQELIRRFGASDMRFYSGNTQLRPFIRMLAKISHAYAVAKLGFDGFHHLLMPIIEGDVGHPAQILIGATTEIPSRDTRHSLDLQCETHHGKKYWVVRIRIFSDLGFPEFICIAGLHLDERNLSLPNGFSSERPWRIPKSEIGAEDRGESPSRLLRQMYLHPKNTEGEVGLLKHSIGIGVNSPIYPPAAFPL